VADCVFCAIVAGRAAAHRLLEDEHTVSFLNIAPATVGHALVAGEAAWQTVFHFHVHVVPRYRADELQLMWRSEPAPGPNLAALRTRILAAERP
jgi:histidine triad (HIT) family protein